jgi:hypothetical protein
VLRCGVLQCSGLASREFVSDVTACGRDSVVVCVCVCVYVLYVGVIHVSGRF